MDAASTFDLFGTSSSTMLTALVFLASATLAFAVMLGVRAREAVRRRAARVSIDVDNPDSRRNMRSSGSLDEFGSNGGAALGSNRRSVAGLGSYFRGTNFGGLGCG